jgi:hypothetical protein
MRDREREDTLELPMEAPNRSAGLCDLRFGFGPRSSVEYVDHPGPRDHDSTPDPSRSK